MAPHRSVAVRASFASAEVCISPLSSSSQASQVCCTVPATVEEMPGSAQSCSSVVRLSGQGSAERGDLTPPRSPADLNIPCAGYDMEDAMILNKSAVDRGLAHATLYKTETLDLHEERGELLP